MQTSAPPHDSRCAWFVDARYGLFVHYGLYSLLGRGEWVRNREQIPREDYAALATRFTAEKFDAEALVDFAVTNGMRYIVFTTMHHDGFRLYHTELSDFCSTKTAARRDLVRELITAAARRDVRVGLYHSLNSWHDEPDAVAALEDGGARARFVERTLARVIELNRNFPTADVLWYDGWWPFDANGWQSEEMNAQVRAINPGILFNGRNGLRGDFGTPENHLTAPFPWRPWEACLTLNESWGWHVGDQDWKTPRDVASALVRVANGQGNLLINVGPLGDGSLPPAAHTILSQTGDWLRTAGESIYATDAFTWDLQVRGHHRSDWSHYGPFTARGNVLYWHLQRPAGATLVLAGLESRVLAVDQLGINAELRFVQEEQRLTITGVSHDCAGAIWPVLRITCETPPKMYLTAGMRVPGVPHPHYDPCPSDLLPS
jgi:alpha-L-fucosidase